MAKKQQPKYYWVYRSAVTGKFISAAAAKRRPKTTVRERRRRQ